MIISRWRGFEIDSSEAYFYFQNDLTEVEEGFDFMRRLLALPLLLGEVSFNLVPLDEHREHVENIMQGKLQESVIREVGYKDWAIADVKKGIEEYEYHDMVAGHLPPQIDDLYITSIPEFLEIVDKLKNHVELISVNFCVAPLKSLPADEYEKFRSWYLDKFKDIERGKAKWDDFCEVKASDLLPGGICEHTDFYYRTFSFDGSFELHHKPPYSYRYNLTGHDPSLTYYVLSQLLEHFTISFGGSHGVSCDNSPDKWDKYEGAFLDDEEAQ